MAAVDAGSSGCDGGDVDHATPPFLQHVWHGEFGQDEGAAQVDVDCVVPFLDADVEYITDSLTISRIDNENICSLPMLLRELSIQSSQISVFDDIALMCRDLS